MPLQETSYCLAAGTLGKGWRDVLPGRPSGNSESCFLKAAGKCWEDWDEAKVKCWTNKTFDTNIYCSQQQLRAGHHMMMVRTPVFFCTKLTHSVTVAHNGTLSSYLFLINTHCYLVLFNKFVNISCLSLCVKGQKHPKSQSACFSSLFLPNSRKHIQEHSASTMSHCASLWRRCFPKVGRPGRFPPPSCHKVSQSEFSTITVDLWAF